MIRIGVSGLIAYEAASRLAHEHRDLLEKEFPRRFLASFDALAKEAAAANETPAGEAWGGFFGTVWRALDTLAESEDLPFAVKKPVGCRIDLQQIPLRQEIIEICELFDENPYEADSAGAYLVIWDEDREKTVWFHMGDPAKDRYDIPFSDGNIVPTGYITESKDRLIINGDMVRYLTPRERQMTDICSRKKDRRSTDGKKR